MFNNYDGGGGSFGNADGYWAQWDSSYRPMHNRQMRPHHAAASYAPQPYVGARAIDRSTPLLPSPFPTLVPVPLFPTLVDHLHNPSLYYDFNAPVRPPTLTINCAVRSIQAEIQWSAPRVNKSVNFVYRVTLKGGAKGDNSTEFAQWKNTTSFPLEPGASYTIVVEAINLDGRRILASGELSFKSTLCKAEMALLQNNAISYVLKFLTTTNPMQPIVLFYRNKPPEYWRRIIETDGIMHPYLKDANGNPGSPINGEINGLFFSARLQKGGTLPTQSPFGGQRLKIACQRLFLPGRHNLYFGDFYCNTTVHYVTVVICIPDTPVDVFCASKLLPLDPSDNPFFRVDFNPFTQTYQYYINNEIWVELYYTADVPLFWGEFDYTVALGQSKPNGVPNNKYCAMCNLYPLAPPAAGSKTTQNGGGNRKRSTATPEDQENNKRPRSGLKYVEIESNVKDDGDRSTFALAMQTMKTLGEKEQDGFVEIQPYVVDVICCLVDEIVESCGGEDSTRKEVELVKVCVPPEDDEGYASSTSPATSLAFNFPKYETDTPMKKSFSKKSETEKHQNSATVADEKSKNASITLGQKSSTFHLDETSQKSSTGLEEKNKKTPTTKLEEIKNRSESFEAQLKKALETFNQIKTAAKNVEKKLAVFR